MMTDNRFKNFLEQYNDLKQKLKNEKTIFSHSVEMFMANQEIPVRLLFFGDTFGIDIVINKDDLENVPRKIPLSVLSDFCEEFGCEFEYTNCDGNRYIFSFDGLEMGG